MESMGGLVKRLPAPISSATFGTHVTKRKLLTALIAFPAIACLGTLSWRSETRKSWMAEYSSEVSQRREVHLADGSRVLLDACSAFDVRFNALERTLILHRGQILVTTGHEHPRRPFTVATEQGELVALGTRFVVTIDDDSTEVAVLQSAVQVTISRQSPRVIRAGERLKFTRSAIGQTRANDASVEAWAHGVHVAVDQPMRELLLQLSRYRSGSLTCDDALASIRVSGTFPLDDSDKSLEALETALPVEVVRYSSYWVHIRPVRQIFR
ncbi:FecR domain-containing protein [Enterobacterales bacterium BD_CKDN230030183-1A_HGKHYDSX7]